MIIVDTLEKYNEAMEFIRQHEMLAFDIETTGLNVRKDKIIGFGVSSALDGVYFPIDRWVPGLDCLVPYGVSPDLIKACLESLKTKKLLCFNAAFDIPFTTNDLAVDLLGSLYADVMLLKHTCDEEFPFGLKEIATKLWGTDVKKEKEAMQASIKENGGTTKEYFKADSELIASYCVQDCLLTFRVYSYYHAELKRQGLEAFFFEQEVMPLYVNVTIPMEQTGVRLNMDLLKQSWREIDQDMATLRTSILSAIEPHLYLFKSWFLNKDYPLQTSTGKQPQWARKGLTQEQAWRKDCPDEAMFNLHSKHHLKKLFFDTLKEEPLSRTPTGQPQVDEEFLEGMAKRYAWAADLIVYNKLTKLAGTYIVRLLEEQEDGYLYPRFFQHRTVSGRYSGDLQQLPRPLSGTGNHPLVCKYTNRIREFIIPRPDSVLVAADYVQLEPTIFAHVSGDPGLQQIFNSDTDFYSEIAIRTERLRDVSSDRRATNYLGTLDKEKRQKAKAYALGIPYGLTGYKLQFELGVTNEEGDKLVQDYLAAFPVLANWMENSKDQARYNGYVKSIGGRVRHLQRAKELFNKFGARLGDSLQLWKDYHNYPELYQEAKTAHKEYKNLCNNAINFQIQSFAASIVNKAAITINWWLKSEGLDTKLIMQVHDELVFDMPQSEVAEVLPRIKDIMETIYSLSVPLRVEPKQGSCYRECK